MKTDFSLTITERKLKEKAPTRTVAAVVYGPGVEQNYHIQVGASEFLKTYRQAGNTNLIALEGLKGHPSLPVLVHQTQQDPVQEQFRHIDFLAVNLKQKTIVTVPLSFINESPAVKEQNGDIVRIKESIEVRCLPSDIPEVLEVDLSALEQLGDQLTLNNLTLDPQKHEVLHLEDDEPIVTVVSHKETVEQEPETTEDENAEGETEEAKAEDKESKES